MNLEFSPVFADFDALMRGALVTVEVTAGALLLGCVMGLLVGIGRLNPQRRITYHLCSTYLLFFRGTPLLVQLFVIFYGLPSVGIVLDPLPAALIGFTLNVGAYNSEVIRGAIESITKGQWEAAYSLSMTRGQALRRTILPQAARVAVPPLSNSFIALVKDTSLAAVLTVPEIFQAAQRIAAVTYEPLILYTEAALIYLAFSSVLSAAQVRLERRFGQHAMFSEKTR